MVYQPVISPTGITLRMELATDSTVNVSELAIIILRWLTSQPVELAKLNKYSHKPWLQFGFHIVQLAGERFPSFSQKNNSEC